MNLTIDEDRLAAYRDLSLKYFVSEGPKYPYLYWDQLPNHLLEEDFIATFKLKDIQWKNDIKISVGIYDNDVRWQGKEFEQYTETCQVKMKVVFKSAIVIPVEFDTTLFMKVKSHILENGDRIFFPTISNPYFKTVSQFHEYLVDTQKRFNLKTLHDFDFGQGTTFGYYADIVRKNRQSQPGNEKIKNLDFLEQLQQCHGEIAVHISNVMVYRPLIDDLLGRKVNHEGDTLYLPNINYYSFQYYMSCTSAIERLYSYWETLIVLLFNYADLDIHKRRLSFGNYMGTLEKKIQNNSHLIFESKSLNLQWILDFYKNKYSQIIQFRHRFIHHEFTSTFDGLLSAKYPINARQNIGKKEALEELNREIRGMTGKLIDHFHCCIEGFRRMLLVIDELP